LIVETEGDVLSVLGHYPARQPDTELYQGGDDHLAQYTAATDAAIEAGFLLTDDREAIIDEADSTRFDG
jgi:hypothetical protein